MKTRGRVFNHGWFYSRGFHSILPYEPIPEPARDVSCCPGSEDEERGYRHSLGCPKNCAHCGIPMEDSDHVTYCSRECSLAAEGRL